MAEEKDVEEQTAEGETGKKQINLKSILMIAGFAVGQIVIIFVAVWVVKSMTHTPAPIQAHEVVGQPDMVELALNPKDPEAKIKAVNAKSGQIVYWVLKIHLQVPKSQADYVAQRLESNQNFIKQEITTIVGACDPVLLQQEADHATLKRQIRFALSKVLGKGTVNAVLISECIPAMLE